MSKIITCPNCNAIFDMREVIPIPDTYTLTIGINLRDAGNVSGGGIYNIGQVATIIAQANPGYVFTNWIGSSISTNPNIQVVMDQNKSVTANFALIPVSPIPLPLPSGPLGSKTNPIPMNKGPERGLVYRPSIAVGKSTSLVLNSKTWFVVDNSIVGGLVRKFTFVTQGFNNVDLFYTKVVQDMAGNDLTVEMYLPNNTGDTQDSVVNNAPYNFNTTRFLYSIEDNGAGFGPPNVWVQFMM